jgi:hypothetical protein
MLCPNCDRATLDDASTECWFCGWTDGRYTAWWWVAVGAFITAVVVLGVVVVLT